MPYTMQDKVSGVSICRWRYSLWKMWNRESLIVEKEKQTPNKNQTLKQNRLETEQSATAKQIRIWILYDSRISQFFVCVCGFPLYYMETPFCSLSAQLCGQTSDHCISGKVLRDWKWEWINGRERKIATVRHRQSDAQPKAFRFVDPSKHHHIASPQICHRQISVCLFLLPTVHPQFQITSSNNLFILHILALK